MGRKVNKRSLKVGNSQPSSKKEKNLLKNKQKKCVMDLDSNGGKLRFSKSLSNIDGIRPFSIAALAVLFGFLNSYHQATMFENDRHFSHLSSLEREMNFRTEMGLYYFYYKTLTESSSFLEGMERLMKDNLTEYPSTINTLERFTLYPEVILAASYRSLITVADYLNISLKECWQVVRGDNLPSIESCEGIGDPAYFYVTCVFLLNGLVGTVMFLYGTFLSNSIAGGILSVSCFFFNHGECTRVQWTPPLRESFGYPLFLLQMMLVTLNLRCRRPPFSHSVIIAIFTSLFTLSWQFAQFALLTQILVLFGLYVLDILSSDTVKCILKAHIISLSISFIFLFGNKMLIASFYTSTVIACLIVISNETVFKVMKNPLLFKVFQGIAVIFVCFSVKMFLSMCFRVQDDAHIWNLLKSKFTSYRDFHTMLYTCAVEFDFLPFETIMEITKTLVLPVGVLTVIFLLYLVLCEKMNSASPPNKNGDVLYNILQCFAFTVMAALVMRLKLFFTPHLCLMVSLIMYEKSLQFMDWKEMKYYILFGLLGAMSVQGIANIKHQRNIIGEFSNPDLEELISWINVTLPPDAVFAGPMPTMANILLSTRRPIVNHPHYENADLRARTRNVYQIFSRKPVTEVYNTLQNMKVNFVVLERSWCFGKRREGCAMVDLWDIEDLENKGRENMCQKIIPSAFPFRKVFRNSVYTVLAL